MESPRGHEEVRALGGVARTRGALGLVAVCRIQPARFGRRAGLRDLPGLVQTLIIGGIFYLAALAAVARLRPSGAPPEVPIGPSRVVLAK